MNISRWSISQIMELPDHLFGQRFPISCCVNTQLTTGAWDIAEVAFPEHFVLWEILLWRTIQASQAYYWRLALGDQVPTVVAMMDGLEPLLPGIGVAGPEPRLVGFAHEGTLRINMLRKPYSAMGRRLVLEVRAAPAQTVEGCATAVVSYMPKEIPDWYLTRQV